MSDPMLVGPANLATVKPEDVADLIGDLRDAGFDARLAHHDVVGAGPEMVETVVVWVAESTGEAAIGAAVTLGIQWMRRRFRSTPHKKSVYVNLYENGSGETVKIIEMSFPDEEPVVKEAHEFERYTQTRPPERKFGVDARGVKESSEGRREFPWWKRMFGG